MKNYPSSYIYFCSDVDKYRGKWGAVFCIGSDVDTFSRMGLDPKIATAGSVGLSARVGDDN